MGGLFKGGIDPLAGVLMKAPDPLRDAIMPVVAKAPKLPDPLMKAAAKAGAPGAPLLMGDGKSKGGYG
jgi:hypothetical protein